MIALFRPILFSFLLSNSVKKLVVDLITAYAKSTETTVDDAIVEMVKRGLGVTDQPADA